MKNRLLLLFPPVVAVAFLIVEGLLSGTDHHGLFLRTEIELVKVLSLVGSLAAAFSFEKGAYLRRAWLFNGGCMAVLLLRDLSLVPAIEALDWPWPILRSALVVVANLSAVIGAWMLARAWRVAGVALPGTRWRQWAVLACSTLLALAFAGPSVFLHLMHVVQGDMGEIWAVASGLGDIVSLTLIAPLLLTAIAFRGGLLVWPWALFTASLVAWLFYDAAQVLGPFLGASEGTMRTLAEVFRSLACMYGFSAGMAQRIAVRTVQTSP